ncbi:Josephin-domain-containing protein [Lactarius hatsudake]|nr:Josephin-domain-containing protein [Lactarius hatsudake]
MAGLEDLTNHVYHEKQESGSMLCAQHALNSLLRFTPSDLSTIAQSLDSLEQRVDQGRVGRESANMDDTGFFSVQVLENALNVWGQRICIYCRDSISLTTGTSHRNQRAFILNYDQHWFTLRRFGNSEGAGYWFNLNSFLDRPEWIGETYLGMVLQQAEAEGYSTFVVMPTDPDHPLPQTDGDVIATTLPPPASSGSQHLSTVHTPQPPAGLEDEDLQLQAALQASLGEAGEGEVSWKRTGSSVTTGGVDTLTPIASMGFPSSSLLLSPPPIPPPSTRPAEQSTGNPVATSMSRNQALLERMRREQEAALREHYHDEVADLEDDRPHRSSLGARNTVEDEDEQLRRAIAESAEMAREQGLTETDDGSVGVGVDPEPAYTGENTQGRSRSDRVYDDEDPELQAALQASLGEAGYGDDDGEGDAATEETGSDTGERPQPPDENISIEEMRRRRLERFGG